MENQTDENATDPLKNKGTAAQKKAIADKAIADKAIADKAIADKAIADKAIADKAIAGKAIAGRSKKLKALAKKEIEAAAAKKLEIYTLRLKSQTAKDIKAQGKIIEVALAKEKSKNQKAIDLKSQALNSEPKDTKILITGAVAWLGWAWNKGQEVNVTKSQAIEAVEANCAIIIE
tara:strand:+ start:7525 stop:8052 length:528 start_codon:yes stop_codon:yes gene_type:complete